MSINPFGHRKKSQ